MRKLLVSSRLKSLRVLTALSRDRFQTTRLRDLFTQTPLPLQIVVRVPKMVPRVKHSWSHLRPPSHPLALPPELSLSKSSPSSPSPSRQASPRPPGPGTTEPSSPRLSSRRTGAPPLVPSFMPTSTCPGERASCPSSSKRSSTTRLSTSGFGAWSSATRLWMNGATSGTIWRRSAARHNRGRRKSGRPSD